jgi:hypothetical protein
VTTVSATIVTMAVLALAGLFPAVALIGLRLITVPLLPLAGAVIAALSATCFIAVGGSFIGWFVGLAVTGLLGVSACWALRPGWRPRRDRSDHRRLSGRRRSVVATAGGLVILASSVWCLRGLATPTVGFDARALWLARAGWFLQSHQQLLVKMRVHDVVLVQSVYPPLVSASTAVAWRVTGDQSMRLGVVVIAILNTCALVVAAYALIDAGRQATIRLTADDVEDGSGPTGVAVGGAPLVPMAVGVVSAGLLVFIAFGVCEPFMTNGYADPIWALAGVGAVAYGLQLGINRTNQGVALILLLVAGMSKDEGAVTALGLIALIAVRRVTTMSGEERRRRWAGPVLIGMAQVAAIGAWPLLMRIIGARGETSASFSSLQDWPTRARIAYDGMAPYLHVIALAAPLAVVGGLILAKVRRRSGMANDWWAWAGLVCGLLAVSGAYVTGTADLRVWLVGTVDRVTDFAALAGWWIVAMWAVVASGAPAARIGGVGSGGSIADTRFDRLVDPIPSAVGVAAE